MDKILSARVDGSMVRRIGILAQRLNTTKNGTTAAMVKLFHQEKGTVIIPAGSV